MIPTTNLHLSQKLQERWPDWPETYFYWCKNERCKEWRIYTNSIGYPESFPAPDLQYLIDRCKELIGPEPDIKSPNFGDEIALWCERCSEAEHYSFRGCDALATWMLEQEWK
jgi:hypothetical protein